MVVILPAKELERIAIEKLEAMKELIEHGYLVRDMSIDSGFDNRTSLSVTIVDINQKAMKLLKEM